MTEQRRLTYRPDIDGLRAVAVLAIILFHLDKLWLPGGFVGVDIFFVISGFLITGNILKEHGANRFSLIELYGRRVRRIVPALLVVVFVTIVSASLLMRPTDAERAAESGGWALASVSNVYFWLVEDRSYFAAENAEEPLLHLWSLGIEEQFYLLWPLMLLGLCRVRNTIARGAVIAVAVVSFLLGHRLYEWDPSFVYYMLPSRAGELLVGGLTAMWLQRSETTRTVATREILAATGVVLVVCSLLWLSETRVFPGLNALPPTLGTAALILAGHRGSSTVSRALALKPLVTIGLMSYSAYLWHWPILAFYRYGYGDPDVPVKVTLLALILLAAWVSYRVVELPGRQVTFGAWKSIVAQYLIPAAAVGSLALGITKTDGYGIRRWSSDYENALRAEEHRTLPAFGADYVCQSGRLAGDDLRRDDCVLGRGDDGHRTALLWGDSNASHYVGMIATFAEAVGFRVRNVAVEACPPLLSDPADHVLARRVGDCRHSQTLVRPLVDDAPVVLLAASWSSYQDGARTFLEAVAHTVHQLSSQGQHVVIIGRAPVIPNYDRRCPEKALSFPFLRCEPVNAPSSPEIVRVNSELRRLAEATTSGYFDPTPFLCEDDVCRSVDSDGEPRYFDAGHLTISASWKLGRQIVARTGVPGAFQELRPLLDTTGAP